ncbi:sensor histidine kinase [Cohnella fermenti]|uniref:histidine kinase n=1 Tax=Cohnella fermenti TaxID=2565925 RepID=A0A4S4C190_9BACL|nr:sensor histidine kinase [Cohnella fermenti]THF80734.1 hypothetical protein E6C55_09610 [Cohnella fermenti]
MLFVWIALWAVAAFMLLADRRSADLRRLGGVAFFGGTGALAAVLDGRFLPYLDGLGRYESWGRLLYHVQAASSVSSYYGVPYFFLLFAISYRGRALSRRLSIAVPLLLLAPIVYCVLFTPGYTERMPISYTIAVWWAVPYIAVGVVLVLMRKPRHAAWSSGYWIVCLSVLPPVVFFAVMNFVLPSLGMMRMWVYNTWFVGLGVAAFVLGLFTYGFMGLSVLVERRRLDSAMRVVTSGTAILNHAIKNDAGKIKLFGEKMKAYAQSTSQPDLLEDIETVLRASSHMQEMISRVHRRTEELVLRPGEADLGELVKAAAATVVPRLGRTRLAVEAEEGWRCRLDAAQVAEALNNVLSNAIEALNGEGALTVRLAATKRELIVEVRDTGPGMDRAQARRALEPFYTTRGGAANFGLGLPYAYHVMRKHGGSLHLDSRPGKGTAVYLSLPKKAAKAVKAAATGKIGHSAAGGGERVGAHQGMDRRG